MINPMYDLLDKYGHEVSQNGVETIMEEWKTRKAAALDLLRRHPAWDEERKAVVLSQDWTRPGDPVTAGSFIGWIFHRVSDVPHVTAENMEELRLAVQSAVSGTEDGSAKVTAEVAAIMNKIQPDVKAVEGQKLSRAIGKFAKSLKVDERPDYNRRYAIAADAVVDLIKDTVAGDIVAFSYVDAWEAGGYYTGAFLNDYYECADRFVEFQFVEDCVVQYDTACGSTLEECVGKLMMNHPALKWSDVLDYEIF